MFVFLSFFFFSLKKEEKDKEARVEAPQVLRDALKAHLDGRVFVDGNNTIVFDDVDD